MLLLTDCKNKDLHGTKPQHTLQDTAVEAPPEASLTPAQEVPMNATKKGAAAQMTRKLARNDSGDQDQKPEVPLTLAQKGKIEAALEGASKLLQAFQDNPNDKQRVQDTITNAQDWEALRSQCGSWHCQKKSAFQRLLKQLEAMSKGPIDRPSIKSIKDPALASAQLLVCYLSGENDDDMHRLLAGLQYVVGAKDFQAPAKDKKSELVFLNLQALIQTL